MPDIEALIRERAYIIWEQSGRPAGRDKDHCFQAAKEADVTAISRRTERLGRARR